MVGQLNPGVWVLGFNHHAKKEDGGDDGPGPEPIPPQQQALALILCHSI